MGCREIIRGGLAKIGLLVFISDLTLTGPLFPDNA